MKQLFKSLHFHLTFRQFMFINQSIQLVYFDDENHTVFTTKEIKLTTKDNRDLILEVSKICPGRTMCPVSKLKLIITLETRFVFLKGKDFFIKTMKRIDLNHRDYIFLPMILQKKQKMVLQICNRNMDRLDKIRKFFRNCKLS